MVLHKSTRLIPTDIEQEMSTAYLDYAMSVIVSRALPDVRDGLKPVQRRILYAMHDQSMSPGSSFKKSARLVGEVLGKYHPHSDVAVYDALVRMAQTFTLRIPLINGQGNYGSMDGDPPAAMRYTECKMAPITVEVLADIDKETVNWRDNFDQSLKEPTVLPSRLPNLLLNGSSGIAVGMATNIPTHNLKELCEALLHLNANPDATIQDLQTYVHGPDFPTGAEIIGKQGIDNAYTTGKGKIVIQSKYHFENVKNKHFRIVFDELPYQINKADLVVKIANIIKKKLVEGITEVRDESNRVGVRVVVELKRGTTPEIIVNNLFQLTPLRTNWSANMICLVNGIPRTITLKDALQHYTHFRIDVIKKVATYDLKKAQARLHILEGLKIAIDNIDEIIIIIKSALDVASARKSLAAKYQLSEIQAQAILDMQLRRLAALEREKIEKEYNAILPVIQELKELLSDTSLQKKKLDNELNEIIEKFAKDYPRKTTIISEELKEWSRDDYEPLKNVVLTTSLQGYIKRIDFNTYKSQSRGGRGVKGQKITKKEDNSRWIQVANTHDSILFFTDRGRVFSKRVFEIPQDFTRNSRGTLLDNIIQLKQHEKVQAMMLAEALNEDTYITFATKKGKAKRMKLKLLKNIRKTGIMAIKLKEDDELIGVTSTNGQDVLIITRGGMSIRFNAEQLQSRSRTSGSVRAITLKLGDEVVSVDAVEKGTSVLVATKNGYGKISDEHHYRAQRRGGKGVRTLRVTKKNGEVIDAKVVSHSIRRDTEGRLILLTMNSNIIRIKLNDIRSIGRLTQGVILANLQGGDELSAICVFNEERRDLDKKVDLGDNLAVISNDTKIIQDSEHTLSESESNSQTESNPENSSDVDDEHNPEQV